MATSFGPETRMPDSEIPSNPSATKRPFSARLQDAWRERSALAQRFGWPASLYDLAYRLANKLADGRVLVTVILRPEGIAAASLHNPHGYAMGFLSAEQIARYAQTFGSKFLPCDSERVLAQGDRCYGILDGERLISFGWYSSHTTRIDSETNIAFDPRYVYMYKGYTDPHYRGQALHALGMAQATKDWATEGFAGLVSYVEANNFASLHSCYRLGYESFGRIRIARLAGRLRVWPSRSCRQYAFRVLLNARHA